MAAAVPSPTAFAKAALRARIRSELKHLSPVQRATRSQNLLGKVLRLPEWKQASRIGIFLSLPYVSPFVPPPTVRVAGPDCELAAIDFV